MSTLDLAGPVLVAGRTLGLEEEAVHRLRHMGINHVTLQLECVDMKESEAHIHP